MASAADIENKLTAILHQAAQKLNLKRYSLDLNLIGNKCDGFNGDFFKASITDSSTQKKIDLVLKKAPTERIKRQDRCIEDLYKNEILFYSQLVPAMHKLEEEHQVSKLFDKIPEYVTSVGSSGSEIIVLKDLTSRGFILREQDLLLDDRHVSLIFRTYGHFHAISFCLRKQKPEEFQELTKLVDNFSAFCTKGWFKAALTGIMDQCYRNLNHQDEFLKEKFKKYAENTMEIFSEVTHSKGDFTCILHGDCWSNNMMYKYEDSDKSKVEDLRLLDFQIIRVGTPVHDLSYFFYTSGSSELFNNLESHLDIYYESFSKCAQELGEDPDKLLPRNILTSDWKKHAKFGMFLAILMTKMKLISKQDAADLGEYSYTEEQINKGDFKYMKLKFDEKVFKKRVRDILSHMHEVDAL